MNDYVSDPDSRLGRRMLWIAAFGLLGGLYLLFSALENEGGTTSSIDSNARALPFPLKTGSGIRGISKAECFISSNM